MKTLPLLGMAFNLHTPESFYAYSKSINKNMGIKRPETVKAKTRKKKTNDNAIDARFEPSPNNPREAEEDAINQQAT